MPSDKVFQLPSFGSVTDPWGPSASIPEALRFHDVPYAPFSKSDKLGKLSDWADPKQVTHDNKRLAHKNHRDPYHAYGASAAASFFNNEDSADFASFSVVDNSKAPKARQTTTLKTKGRNAAPATSRPTGRPVAGAARNQPPQGKGAFPPRRKFAGWKEERPQKHRDASVKVGEGWKLIQSNQFAELQKLSFDVKAGIDVGNYGYALPYNRDLDKPNSSKVLRHLERAIYNSTTSDDPVIQKLASTTDATIFATDSIISLLMCATKSVYPWDIVINKSEGKIFLDKRDDGPLDYVTVDENAYDPPSDGADVSNINSASNLSTEATYINQNFAANAVTDKGKVKFEHENPFSNPEDNAAPLPTAYRYRQFNLANNPEEEALNLIIRTEIGALAPGKTDQFVTVKALNEYGPNGVLEWKQKFANQRGAIVAAEMKKNLNKLSRWTVESLLAGSSSIKIGFVSRQTPKDNAKHTIVGVVGQVPAQFANQLNLKISNGWGIVKSIVNIIAALDDGKYVLMKDPNAPNVKIYSVPQNTFEEAEEEE